MPIYPDVSPLPFPPSTSTRNGSIPDGPRVSPLDGTWIQFSCTPSPISPCDFRTVPSWIASSTTAGLTDAAPRPLNVAEQKFLAAVAALESNASAILPEPVAAPSKPRLGVWEVERVPGEGPDYKRVRRSAKGFTRLTAWDNGWWQVCDDNGNEIVSGGGTSENAPGTDLPSAQALADAAAREWYEVPSEHAHCGARPVGSSSGCIHPAGHAGPHRGMHGGTWSDAPRVATVGAWEVAGRRGEVRIRESDRIYASAYDDGSWNVVLRADSSVLAESDDRAWRAREVPRTLSAAMLAVDAALRSAGEVLPEDGDEWRATPDGFYVSNKAPVPLGRIPIPAPTDPRTHLLDAATGRLACPTDGDGYGARASATVHAEVTCPDCRRLNAGQFDRVVPVALPDVPDDGRPRPLPAFVPRWTPSGGVPEGWRS